MTSSSDSSEKVLVIDFFLEQLGFYSIDQSKFNLTGKAYDYMVWQIEVISMPPGTCINIFLPSLGKAWQGLEANDSSTPREMNRAKSHIEFTLKLASNVILYLAKEAKQQKLGGNENEV